MSNFRWVCGIIFIFLVSSSCLHDEDLEGAIQVRLGEPYSEAGAVFIFHHGEWRGICSDEWSLTDGRIACKQLGFTDIVNLQTYAVNGEKVWLGEVSCSGSESRLIECDLSEWEDVECPGGELAGIDCTPSYKNDDNYMNINNDNDHLMGYDSEGQTDATPFYMYMIYVVFGFGLLGGIIYKAKRANRFLGRDGFSGVQQGGDDPDILSVHQVPPLTSLSPPPSASEAPPDYDIVHGGGYVWPQPRAPHPYPTQMPMPDSPTPPNFRQWSGNGLHDVAGTDPEGAQGGGGGNPNRVGGGNGPIITRTLIFPTSTGVLQTALRPGVYEHIAQPLRYLHPPISMATAPAPSSPSHPQGPPISSMPSSPPSYDEATKQT